MVGSATPAAPPGRIAAYLGASLVVMLWKALALARIVAGDAEAGVALVQALLAAVGLVFLVCGLVVLRRRCGHTAALFAGFCLSAGLHWGGPIELSPGPLRTALVLLYVILSSFLAESLFLRLALSFPRQIRLARLRLTGPILFSPVALATVLAAVYLAAPAGGELRAAAEGWFSLLHLVVSNLYPLLVLALFIGHLVRAGLTRREKRHVAMMVGGMLTAWLPYLAAAAAGLDTDPWNLAMVALPVSFTIGILGIERPAGREGVT